MCKSLLLSPVAVKEFMFLLPNTSSGNEMQIIGAAGNKVLSSATSSGEV